MTSLPLPKLMLLTHSQNMVLVWKFINISGDGSQVKKEASWLFVCDAELVLEEHPNMPKLFLPCGKFCKSLLGSFVSKVAFFCYGLSLNLTLTKVSTMQIKEK